MAEEATLLKKICIGRRGGRHPGRGPGFYGAGDRSSMEAMAA